MIDFFSPDYFTARIRFRSAVLARGGQIESILLDAQGPAGKDLTIDIGWFGSPAPKCAFIHSCGLHGMEGFAGAAIQLQCLEDDLPQPAPGCAIVLVHALNPFGMAWLRCVNENNLDLNRNFLGADAEFSGAPDDYAALDRFLNPASPPSSPWPELFTLRAAGKILRYGMPLLRRAIASGQYDFPHGLFFGGKRHEQGPRRFHLYLSGRFSVATRLVAIDVHTASAASQKIAFWSATAKSRSQARPGCSRLTEAGFSHRLQKISDIVPMARRMVCISACSPPLRSFSPPRNSAPGIPSPFWPHCARKIAAITTAPRSRGKRSRETTITRSLLPVGQALV